MSNKQKIQLLGYSGLLPFIFLPLLMLLNEGMARIFLNGFFIQLVDLYFSYRQFGH